MASDRFPQIEGNCLITNYKPPYYDEKKEEKKHNINDINIFVTDGQLQEIGKVTEKNIQNSGIDYLSIFKAVASLGGDKDKVEISDINSIDKLIGIHKIKQIAKDIKNGAVRLIFDNGEQLRIDFETEEEAKNPNYSEEYRLGSVRDNEDAYKRVQELKNNEDICKRFDIEMEMDAEQNFTGKVAITLKKSIDTDTVRLKLNLNEGVLLDLNKELLDQKYQEQKANSFFIKEGPQYDNLTLKAGTTLYIDSFYFA